MFCGNCGGKSVEGDRFCGTCGQAQRSTMASEFVSAARGPISGPLLNLNDADPAFLETERAKNKAKNHLEQSSVRASTPPWGAIGTAVMVTLLIIWLIFKVGPPIVNLVSNGGTTSAQSTAEREANQAGQSDGSQLRQNMDDAIAKDFCVRTGDTNRDWQQSSNSLTDEQADSLIGPYVEGCMQGYKDSRR